jgi:hypothetical protein
MAAPGCGIGFGCRLDYVLPIVWGIIDLQLVR